MWAGAGPPGEGRRRRGGAAPRVHEGRRTTFRAAPYLAATNGEPGAGLQWRRSGDRTPEPQALVARALTIPDEAQRVGLYAEIQAELDASLPIVPLYAPRRVAIARAELALPRELTHDMYGLDLRFLGAQR